jgi:hypothetical protein
MTFSLFGGFDNAFPAKLAFAQRLGCWRLFERQRTWSLLTRLSKITIRERTMRNIVLVAAVGAAMFLLSAAGVSAAPAVPSPLAAEAASESVLKQVQSYSYCERLRVRCKYKYELGEEGDGNCRRWREQCADRGGYCERLRYKCRHKYERGEEGEGNCRRYREECGGRN